MAWECLPDALEWADVVVTATGAPHSVVQAVTVRAVLPRRAGRPLWLVDIAVPRDVDRAVGRLPRVFRYDVDDLRSVLDAGLIERQAAVPAVEVIVEEEVERFMGWLAGQQMAPLIAGLRRKAEAVASAEVEQALRRLEAPGRRDHEVVLRLAHRIVNKLLHQPTQLLKAHAGNGDYLYARAVRELFALDDPPAGRNVASRPTDEGTAAAAEPGAAGGGAER
jgi:glutamyl-tRNA reductase